MIYGGLYLAHMEEKVVDPFCERTQFDWFGHLLSYGCGFGSYDVRLDQDILIRRDEGIVLASTMERFIMPNYMEAIVHDKSSLVRRGLKVQNTLIDPGWRGFLTLELEFVGSRSYPHRHIQLKAGMPIAQVVFHQVTMATPYEGKYQDQERGPQEAR